MRETPVWACHQCGDHRWVGWRAGPAYEGFTRYAQCVLCGSVQDLPVDSMTTGPDEATWLIGDLNVT